MAVTIKVLEKKGNIYTIQAVYPDDRQILKSPVKCSGGKDKVEAAIRKQFKSFDGPLWGGMSIYWMIKI